MSTAEQYPSISVGATKVAPASFVDELDDTESLTGTPTVEEVGSSDLTIDNVAVNTSILEILGDSVAIGKAVQFRVTGVVAAASYKLKITVGTNSTPAQTLIGYVKLSGACG